jgi:hypothetical protein
VAWRGSISCEQDIYPIGFKQPDWRYSSRPFCHSSSGPSPHQGLAAGQLDVLDRASNVATVGLLIAVTLSTRHRSPLGWLRPPGSSPRAAAVAQRLSALAHLGSHGRRGRRRLSGVVLSRRDHLSARDIPYSAYVNHMTARFQAVAGGAIEAGAINFTDERESEKGGVLSSAPVIAGAEQISTRAVGYGEGPYGHGGYGGPPQVVIDIDTSTMRYVGQIVDSALRLLEGEMARLNIET